MFRYRLYNLIALLLLVVTVLGSVLGGHGSGNYLLVLILFGLADIAKISEEVSK